MTGRFACACDALHLRPATAASLELKACGRPCTGDRDAIAAGVKKRALDGAVIVGCPLLFQPGMVAAIAAEVGLAPSRLVPVVLRRKGSAEEAKRAVRRAAAALAAMKPIETRRVKLDQRVLVVGDGRAALDVARSLAALGFGITLAHDSSTADRAPEGIEELKDCRLTSLAGFPGAFEAEIAAPEGAITRRCGAVVLATMPKPRLPAAAAGDGTVALSGLLGHLASLRRRQLPRSLAILLDLSADEGVASSASAFRACLEVRSRHPSIAVTLALRDAKVADLGLEKLYDEVREGGVSIVKHAGAARIRPDASGAKLVELRDEVLGKQVAMRFDLVATSDLETASDADRELAASLGLGTDPQGQLQDDNVRLLPGRTGRPGVFVVGACRGEAWEPAIARDAAETAAAVRELLAAKPAMVELGHAVVDGDKCALCLTCIRTCPAKAMRILAEEQRADCIPEACRRCGICVGECPNRAITLPAWSEEVVMALAGAAARGAAG